MSSGDLFGWTQNAGMGWSPAAMLGKQYLILSTQGGVRAPDGTPIALGYHTGHWEVGLLMEEAAKTFSAARAIPFAAYVSDPCDGRTNGTAGMLDSLAYRNDAVSSCAARPARSPRDAACSASPPATRDSPRCSSRSPARPICRRCWCRLTPVRASERGLTSTITFLRGNLAPEGALAKSTAISPTVVGADGVFRHEGPARVFPTEGQAIAAVKSGSVKPGDGMVLMGIGPGIGLPETYQITSAIKYVKGGERIALVTDGRFSGVPTGACVGHVSPEAWAGGPLARVRDGDTIRLVVDTRKLEGSVDLIAPGAAEFAARPSHPNLQPDPRVPTDTRLSAALQNASGGSWGGCIDDADKIIAQLQRGQHAP